MLPKTNKPAYRFERLEPRILLSADPISAGFALLAPDAPQDEPLLNATQLPLASFLSDEPAANDSPELSIGEVEAAYDPPEDSSRAIVFVDSRVEDYQSLLEGLEQNVEVVVLHANTDGLTQIGDYLAAAENVGAVHVVSHGSEQGLWLGATWLDTDALDARASEVANWSHALNDDADILLYGCNLAASADGQALIDYLAELTNADVAASDDLTGHTALGGDWVLEYRSGKIDNTAIFSANALENWAGVLGQITVTTNADQLDGDADTSSLANLALTPGADGFVSLREAIAAANTDIGADTIFLQATSYGISIIGSGDNQGDHDIRDDLSIVGISPTSTTINGGNIASLFDVHDDAAITVSFSNLKLEGGRTMVVGEEKGGALNIEGTANATNVFLDNVWFSSNVATFFIGEGGAIYNAGNLTITNSLFDANKADEGGAIYNAASGTLNMTNVTLSGNAAEDGHGGGLYNLGDATLRNVTITANDAQDGTAAVAEGGGIYIGGGTVDIANSIVADNNAEGSAKDVFGTVTSSGSNIIKDGSGSSGFGIGEIGVDPVLGALSDNGGKLQTHAPTAVVAIDSADPSLAPVVDQRGFVRSDGSPDIGAYEDSASITPVEGNFWFTTWDPVASGGQTGLDTWDNGDINYLGDPELHFGPGPNSGTVFNGMDFSVAAPALEGLHLVSRNVRIGSGGFQLLAGDILLNSRSATAVFNSNNLTPLDPGFAASINADRGDIVVFRPDYAGDYSTGAYAFLLDDVSGSGDDLFAMTLVEQSTNVGGTPISAGDFLFVKGSGAGHEIWIFDPTTTGDGTTTGTRTLLLDGGDGGVNITDDIHGLELIESTTMVGGQILSSGQIVAAINNSDSVGSNNLDVTENDAFVLSIGQSTAFAGGGLGQATASTFLTGADIAFDSNGERFRSLALQMSATTGHYLDRFDTNSSYAGDDGSLSWTNDWQEVGEADGAGGGQTRVWDGFVGDGGNIELQVRNNTGAWREADLSGAGVATLSFDYAREFHEANDDLVIYIQSGGTGSVGIAGAPGTWDELARYSGPATDTSFLSDSIDISAYISNDTRIMFLDQGGLPSSQWGYVDNVRIDLSGQAIGIKPTADPSAGTPHIITETAPVSFDGSASFDPDGSITSWGWDVGNDGSFEKSGVNVTYTWGDLMAAGVTDDGTYSVVLRVTDNDSNTDVTVFTLTVNDNPPTFTTFTGVVDTTVEDTEVEISFADLIAQGDENDPYGTVDAFVVQGLASGTLNIGTDAGTATPYASGTNDVIDGALNAYWTPGTGQSGILGAFSVEARDDDNNLSGIPITARVSVTSADSDPVFVNSGPFSVDENASVATIVGDVDANDGDGADPGLTDLIFTEIMYNPASTPEFDWEWVELYNGGSEVIDLAGFVFDDDNTLAVSGTNIASGMVSPGETGILYNADAISAADFTAAWGAGLNLIAVTEWDDILLANAGEQLSLWQNFADYSGDHETHGNAFLTFNYDDIAPWPTQDGFGSIFLTDLNTDPNVGNNWALSTIGLGSPHGGTAAQSTAANGNSGTDVGTPGDAVAGGGVTYSIVTNANPDADGQNAFAIDSATGVITVNDTDDLDFEGASSLAITVRADDGVNQTDTVVTINLNDLNEQLGATLVNQTKTYTEDDASVAIDDIVITDVDAGETITASLTLADNNAGSLTISGGATYTGATGVWTITDTVANVNTALANMAFTPATNYNSNTSISVDIRDGGENGTIAVTGTINLNGTPQNDAPTISGAPISLGSTDEDTVSTGVNVGSIVSSFTTADVDGDTLGIAITAASGSNVWQYSTDSTDGSDGTWTNFSAVTSSSALLLNNGSWVRYNPNSINAENVALTFRAWDGSTGTASTFGSPQNQNPGLGGGITAYSSGSGVANLTVTDVNDIPTLTTFSGDVDFTVEDTEVEITFADLASQGDEADVDGTVDYFVVQAVSTGTLKIGADAGSATAYAAGVNDRIGSGLNAYWTPANDQNGTLNAFTLEAQDDDGALSGSPITAQVNVSDVNDAPTLTTFAASIDVTNEDTEVEITFADLAAQGNEADVDGTVDYFVVQAVSTGTLKIGADAGSATAYAAGVNDRIGSGLNAYWTPANDQNGTLNAFTVEAQDDDGALSGSPITAQVNVSDVNDAPTLTTFAAAIDVTNEDTEVEITFAELAAQGNEADVDGSVTGFVVQSISSGTLKIGASAATATAYAAGVNDVIGVGLNAYWTPANNQNGTSNAFTVVAKDDDGALSVGSALAPVTVTAINDAPVIAGTITNPTATEVGSTTAAVALLQSGSVTVNDPDVGNFNGGTITVALDGYRAGDVLSIAGLPTGLASVSGGTASDLTITLNAAATPSNVETILEALRFRHNGDDPTGKGTDPSRAYTITLNDGGNTPGPALDSNSLNGTITLADQNDIPTFTSLSGPIDGANTLVEEEIFFSDIHAFSDAVDVDGTINGYVVKNVISGSLRIGTNAASATAFAAGVNDTIDATNHAYWTSAPTASGLTDAFDLVALDNAGSESSGLVRAQVNVFAVNQAPIIDQNTLDISEGQATILDGLDLAASDVDDSDPSLQFAISNLTHGQFERVSLPGIAVTSFTQSEITAGNIRFVHDGSEDAPSYSVKVSDGALTTPISPATIMFTNVNDAPSIGLNQLTIDQGGSITLTVGTDLSASDSDDDSSALTYTVASLSAGHFAYVSTPDTPITTFTQAEINSGAVQFVHDGSSNAPSYTLTVSDGTANSRPSLATITFNETSGDDFYDDEEAAASDYASSEALKDLTKSDPNSGPEKEGDKESDESAQDGDQTDDALIAQQQAIADATSKGTSPNDITTTGLDDYLLDMETDGSDRSNAREAVLNGIRGLLGSQLKLAAEIADPMLLQIDAALDLMASVVQSSGFKNSLDELRDEIAEDAFFDKAKVGSTVAVSTGLSVGYVVWLIRGGVLLSSMLSALPAWRFIDPLPVLAFVARDDDDEDADGESLESLVRDDPTTKASAENTSPPSPENPTQDKSA